MKALTFYLVSQIGMFLGTIIFVNAGVQLSKINKIEDIENSKLRELLIFIKEKHDECKDSLETETDVGHFIREIMLYLNSLELNLVNEKENITEDDEEEEVVYNINKEMIDEFVKKKIGRAHV